MNCFIFHKFSKWAKYAEGKVEEHHIPTGKNLTTGSFIKQSRECQTCGLVQLRHVEA